MVISPKIFISRCSVVFLFHLMAIEVSGDEGFLNDFFTRFPHLPFSKIHPSEDTNNGYYKTLLNMHQSQKRSFNALNEKPTGIYRSPKYIYTDMSKYYQPETIMNEKQMVPKLESREGPPTQELDDLDNIHNVWSRPQVSSYYIFNQPERTKKAVGYVSYENTRNYPPEQLYSSPESIGPQRAVNNFQSNFKPNVLMGRYQSSSDLNDDQPVQPKQERNSFTNLPEDGNFSNRGNGSSSSYQTIQFGSTNFTLTENANPGQNSSATFEQQQPNEEFSPIKSFHEDPPIYETDIPQTSTTTGPRQVGGDRPRRTEALKVLSLTDGLIYEVEYQNEEVPPAVSRPQRLSQYSDNQFQTPSFMGYFKTDESDEEAPVAGFKDDFRAHVESKVRDKKSLLKTIRPEETDFPVSNFYSSQSIDPYGGIEFSDEEDVIENLNFPERPTFQFPNADFRVNEEGFPLKFIPDEGPALSRPEKAIQSPRPPKVSQPLVAARPMHNQHHEAMKEVKPPSNLVQNLQQFPDGGQPSLQPFPHGGHLPLNQFPHVENHVGQSLGPDEGELIVGRPLGSFPEAPSFHPTLEDKDKPDMNLFDGPAVIQVPKTDSFLHPPPGDFPQFSNNFEHGGDFSPVKFEIEDARTNKGISVHDKPLIEILSQTSQPTRPPPTFPPPPPPPSAPLGPLPPPKQVLEPVKEFNFPIQNFPNDQPLPTGPTFPNGGVLEEFPDFFKQKPESPVEPLKFLSDIGTQGFGPANQIPFDDHKSAKREQPPTTVGVQEGPHFVTESEHPLTVHPRPGVEVQLQRPTESVTQPSSIRGRKNPMKKFLQRSKNVLDALTNGLKMSPKIMGSVSHNFQGRRSPHVVTVSKAGKPLKAMGMAKMSLPENHVIVFGDGMPEAMASKFFVDNNDDDSSAEIVDKSNEPSKEVTEKSNVKLFDDVTPFETTENPSSNVTTSITPSTTQATNREPRDLDFTNDDYEITNEFYDEIEESVNERLQKLFKRKLPSVNL